MPTFDDQPPFRCEDILAQARAATGGDAWDAVVSIKVAGTISAGGLSGPYEQSVALQDGRSVTQYTLGPLKAAKGFDGATAWQRGATGEVLRQESEASAQAARTEAYLNARGPLFASRWNAAVEALGTRHEEGCDYAVLLVTPECGQPVQLWFDRATHLLARTVQHVLGRESTKRFGDYRRVDGVLLPLRIATGSGEARFDIVTVLESVTLNPEAAASAFTIPVQAMSDFSIIGGSRSATAPMTLVNNHVYLPVAINGATFNFILDTGGMNVLTPEAAARAGIVAEGAMEARGPGEQSVSAGFARVARLEIGGAVALERQLFRVLPFPGFEQVEGTSFDGVIGVEVFKRFVVAIDYANARVRFELPAEFAAADSAITLPITFHGHFPTVDGTFDGLAGQFWLDTGNRNALTLWAPFVAEHALMQRYGASAETTIGWGLGGRASGHVACGGALTLGGVVIPAPLLTLKRDGDGATAVRNVAGNIGGEILRRFVVSFDYSRQVVHLEPNAHVGDPFHHDRSGMWINRRGDGFVVMSVLAQGPADEAGLQVDDVVTHVGDRAAALLELDDLRRVLRDPATGDELRLRIERAGQPREAALRLRDLVPRA